MAENHFWSDIGPLVGGAGTILLGLVWGPKAMPGSNLAPAVGIFFCPVGALAGWFVGMIIDYLKNRR